MGETAAWLASNTEATSVSAAPGVDTIFIEPGSRRQNAFVESFNGHVRDECLNVEAFGSLVEAQAVIEVWRVEYNAFRPHSSLNALTPAESAAQYARSF